LDISEIGRAHVWVAWKLERVAGHSLVKSDVLGGEQDANVVRDRGRGSLRIRGIEPLLAEPQTKEFLVETFRLRPGRKTLVVSRRDPVA
jgi:hypothetical protein